MLDEVFMYMLIFIGDFVVNYGVVKFVWWDGVGVGFVFYECVCDSSVIGFYRCGRFFLGVVFDKVG